MKRLKSQEEKKSQVKEKKKRGRPPKNTASKLTPGENDKPSKSDQDIICSSCETEMAKDKENMGNWLTCEDCPNWVCFECLPKKFRNNKGLEFQCDECLD